MALDKPAKRTRLATAVFLAISSLLLFVASFGTGVPPAQASDQSVGVPSLSINLTPSNTVRQGTEIAVNLIMRGLEENSDKSTLMYEFRADVVDHDSCEEGSPFLGYRMGGINEIYLVDEETERRWVTVSPDCPVGNYTINATLSDSLNNELATASTTFSVVEPSLPTGVSFTTSSDGFIAGVCASEIATAFWKEDQGKDFASRICRESPVTESYIRDSRFGPGMPVFGIGPGSPQAPTLSAAVSGDAITLAWSYWFSSETSNRSTGGVPDSFIIKKTWTDANDQTSSTDISVSGIDALDAYAFYTDTSVVEGVSYTYTIAGKNGSGEGETSEAVAVSLPSGSGSATAPTSAPSAPTNLAASVTDEGIVLSWSPPDDASVFGYEVLRRIPELANGGMGTYIGFTNKASVVDPQVDLEAPYRYEYVVRAININGVGEFSDRVAVSPAGTCSTDYSNAPAPTSRPTMPGNLTAAQESGGISLRWDAPTDETVSAYLVLRRSLKSSNGLKDSMFIIGRTFCKTETAYLDSTTEPGTQYRYRVRAINDFDRGISWWSNVVDLVANTPASGAPSISGTAQVGGTLAASTSGIADSDGMDNVSFSYQWLADDIAISGAAGPAYTLSDAEEGKAIKVRVSFTDDAGNDEMLASAPTTPVLEAADLLEPTDRPHSLTAAATEDGIVLSWQEPDITRMGASDYHLLRHRPELGEAEPLVYVDYTYTTDTTFTDIDVEPGVLYVYQVRAVINVFGDLGEASLPVQIRMPGPTADHNTLPEGLPTISGTARVGETLTADTSAISDSDGMDNVSFSYQWLADDADIEDATNSTYTLVDADDGKAIKVRVSFSDDAGYAETLTSAATSAVSAAPTALTAQFLDTPSSHDGQTSFTFELRFSEELHLSYVTLRDHAFTVTGGEVTRARRLERPGNIRWEITVRPDGDGDATIVLPVTTNCAAQEAICTGDGRRLSNRTELIIGKP